MNPGPQSKGDKSGQLVKLVNLEIAFWEGEALPKGLKHLKHQSPSRVVVRYLHHTPLQWAEWQESCQKIPISRMKRKLQFSNNSIK